ncbi:uncharacterized protein BT62DRAFT_917917 [Guyanagaster necrorhizus]|uniref:DNA replication factor Cdt1 C-terminal domain-containing protein n=1 Tax=Guyanagaster necrorhizus TaxID=856835 RepID=A0A9P7VYM5_9AGAR|nr:uncharacterized protein BT62DRAFT_917917 [Guyanagaster necrorhizus MCA 3950]KAG7449342.1 hypothetical protein BT62DRAFT_917917 [Guyanagaster necrorhizus MCA 3950]
MSGLYSTLQVSPKKKRCPPELNDTDYTPKRLRTAPITPPATVSKKKTPKTDDLPTHLSRLQTIQTGLQHALSHALASCAVSPSSDTGIVRNVLNHLSLTTYTGLTTQFTSDDLRRLCWLWEWDGISPPEKHQNVDDDENPFWDSPASQSKDWIRGSMGIVISPATYYSKADKKRVAAYGIGIEVEMDIDKDMGGGMAAVARWTAGAETRRKEFHAKLIKWCKLHSDELSIPPVPMADLPKLSALSKPSSLTRVFASISPKASASFAPPLSPGSPSKSPTKRGRDFAIPFPITPSSRQKSPTKNSILFPQTPSKHDIFGSSSIRTLAPRTPTTSNVSVSDVPSEPSTPVHQRGRNASTVPHTPTTARRQALYERVRQRSLSASPTKALSNDIIGGRLTRDQMLKLGQEEMRRRCLLGRLGGVAESVWMLFSGPVSGSSTSTPSKRKRRALPMSEVVNAVIKSSPVPISAAEASESLEMLLKLCPFFLKKLNISGEEWLEMPAPKTSPINVDDSTPGTFGSPSSPGSRKAKADSAEEVLTRSPKRVKKETGGLREVREIIRRELELQD